MLRTRRPAQLAALNLQNKSLLKRPVCPRFPPGLPWFPRGEDLARACEAIDRCISNVLCVANEERAMSDKRPQQERAMLDRASVATSRGEQGREVEWGEVSQAVGFQVAPDDFYGIEFGCVSGK